LFAASPPGRSTPPFAIGGRFARRVAGRVSSGIGGAGRRPRRRDHSRRLPRFGRPRIDGAQDLAEATRARWRSELGSDIRRWRFSFNSADRYPLLVHAPCWFTPSRQSWDRGLDHFRLPKIRLPKIRSANFRLADVRFAQSGTNEIRSSDFRLAPIRPITVWPLRSGRSPVRPSEVRFANLRFAKFGPSNFRLADFRFHDSWQSNGGFP
jgi:hypothetical protein